MEEGHDDHEDHEMQDLLLYMSDNGLKSMSGINYISKFKDIHWTSEINRECPIKIQESVHEFGTERPSTLSIEFLEKALKNQKKVCMKMKKYQEVVSKFGYTD